jgi:drug/metabolite transporter (DMT)-like permease
MRWQVLLGLVLCNFVWSTVPVAGKWALMIYSPMEVGFLRYGAAFLLIVTLGIPFAVRRPREIFRSLRKIFAPMWWPWYLLVGTTTFFISPLVQYWGLAKSTASANALIVATEPLITAFVAWLFLREKIKSVQWLGFLIAMAGFLLLSNLNPTDPITSLSLFNAANFFFLLQMPCEAIYTVVARKFGGDVRISEKELYAGSITVGVVCLATALLITSPLPDLTVITPKVFFAVLWMGALGNGICYLYWSKALEETPVATVALTLFVQPILGTVWGQVFLGETLNFWQITGAVFILSALALQIGKYRKEK